MNKNEYLENLIIQFVTSRGIKNIDFESKDFMDEFANWIYEMEQKGLDYLSFIKSISSYSDINDKQTAEIGKGKLDSIGLNTSMTLITPYLSDTQSQSQSIIQADFRVVDSTPTILRGNNNAYIGDCGLARFMTQNPYSRKNIVNWEKLHNFGKGNITVGVYGDINDKDADSKIKIIKSLKEKLVADLYVEEYITSGNSYFYAISSDRKVLRKKKYMYR